MASAKSTKRYDSDSSDDTTIDVDALRMAKYRKLKKQMEAEIADELKLRRKRKAPTVVKEAEEPSQSIVVYSEESDEEVRPRRKSKAKETAVVSDEDDLPRRKARKARKSETESDDEVEPPSPKKTKKASYFDVDREAQPLVLSSDEEALVKQVQSKLTTEGEEDTKTDDGNKQDTVTASEEKDTEVVYIGSNNSGKASNIVNF